MNYPKQTPLVSIVTPSYNQGKYLEDTILSVLSQDYVPIEYLIIDGGSTDSSVEIIRKYSDQIIYWETQPDRGQAHAINKGLIKAKGEILGWLNADDLLLPETVSRVVDRFEAHPEIDVIYGRLQRINEFGKLIPTPELPKDRITFGTSKVVGECIVNQPGAFWNREIMEMVGLLNEDLHFSLDYEYWIRMALAGARFMRIPEVVAWFRLDQGSKTVSRTTEMAVEQLSVLDELLKTPGLSEMLAIPSSELSKQADRTRANIQLHAFYGALKRHKWNNAWHWFWKANRSYPFVVMQRRWFDLALAGLARRARYSR